ncbi:hypothetical protein VTL71DRAFT_6543 [Oculimacula yallundae]|uniref:Protein-S-isoprenylcysteine O-methyltransferase n=1 Tax=Oculimacula yallundae TaxID=86028 RepID=A0ABR4BXY0_9HELO
MRGSRRLHDQFNHLQSPQVVGESRDIQLLTLRPQITNPCQLQISTAMEMPDLLTVLHVLISLLASYLSMLCFSNPNPDPNTTSAVSDRIIPFASFEFLLVRRVSILIIGINHALLILNPTAPNYLICPSTSSLNLSLFTWTRYSAICLALILIFAPIRLLAFAQLGKNFTFKLAKPQNLVTTGLYAYMQHPSYTANSVVATAHLMLFERPDGLAGCWMSESVAKSPWWGVVGLVLVAVVVHLGRQRVVDEEDMLKKAFGKEWEVWHQKTKRFVPWVI